MPDPVTIQFDPAGGPLFARAQAGHAAMGSYGFLLFESDGVTEVPMPQPSRGHFGSAEQNTHALPGTAAENDGRLLTMSYSVALDDTRAFAVHLKVLQDGREVGSNSDAGVEPGAEDTHDGQMVAELAARAVAVTAMRPGVAKAARAKQRPAAAKRGAKAAKKSKAGAKRAKTAKRGTRKRGGR